MNGEAGCLVCCGPGALIRILQLTTGAPRVDGKFAQSRRRLWRRKPSQLLASNFEAANDNRDGDCRGKALETLSRERQSGGRIRFQRRNACFELQPILSIARQWRHFGDRPPCRQPVNFPVSRLTYSILSK